MPEDQKGISFITFEDTVKSAQATFEDLKKILDQLNKPRSVVCSIVNATDLPLTFGGENQDHGGFSGPPPISIPPRSGGAFGAQSDAGALATGTEGTVWYNAADGTSFRFHWDNPWAGDNGSESEVTGPLAALYKTWTVTGEGDQNAQMQFVALQVMPTPFHDIWVRLGGATGLLGMPTTDYLPTPDGIGCMMHFEGGSIYSSPPSGTHEVHGAIRDKWASLGWEQSFLGYPISDEAPTPDSIGRYSHFQYGSIYWTPTTGAHEVHGRIRDKWASLGWEKSSLGYPTSDEQDTPNGTKRFSRFQHGAIVMDKTTGTVAVKTLYELRFEEGELDKVDDGRLHVSPGLFGGVRNPF
jgi:uncharacterized protein with LGFP repeats